MRLCNCKRNHGMEENVVNNCNVCNKPIKIEWDKRYDNIPVGKEFVLSKESEVRK